MPSISELSPQDSGTHSEAQTPEPRGHRNCFARFMLCGRGALAEPTKEYGMSVEIEPARGDAAPHDVLVDEANSVTAATTDGAKIKGRLTKRPPPIKTPASRKRPMPLSDNQTANAPELSSVPPEPVNAVPIPKQGEGGHSSSDQVRAFLQCCYWTGGVYRSAPLQANKCRSQ